MHRQIMVIGLLSAVVAVMIPGIFIGRVARRPWGGARRVTPRAVRMTVSVGSIALIVQSVGVYMNWLPRRGPWSVLDAILVYGYAVLTVAFVTLLLPEFRRRRKAGCGNRSPRDPRS